MYRIWADLVVTHSPGRPPLMRKKWRCSSGCGGCRKTEMSRKGPPHTTATLRTLIDCSHLATKVSSSVGDITQRVEVHRMWEEYQASIMFHRPATQLLGWQAEHGPGIEAHV